MRIVKAESGHSGKAVELRMEMLREVNGLDASERFSEDFIRLSEEYFINGDQTTFLAIEGEKAVGCATVCYIRLMPTFDHRTGKRAHIMNVYVKPEYRRRGLAGKMLQEIICEAKQKGVTQISLDATDKGRPLYETLGFLSSAERMELNL